MSKNFILFAEIKYIGNVSHTHKVNPKELKYL